MKYKTKLFLTILIPIFVLVMLTTVVATVYSAISQSLSISANLGLDPWGDGSEDNPYIIYSIGSTTGNSARGSFNYYAGNNASSKNYFYNDGDGAYFKQANNISESDGYTLIDVNNFQGVYDGGGYTITCSGNDAVFDSLGGGENTILNLTVVNNNVLPYRVNTSSNVVGADYSGIVGSGNDVVLQNVNFYGNIDSSDSDYDITTGAGLINDAISSYNLVNCHNYANITLKNGNASGLLLNSADASGIISESSNRGDIKSILRENSIDAFYGACGFVSHLSIGDNFSSTSMTINNSYNSGDISILVEGNFTYTTTASGIVGYSSYTTNFNSCYNTGDINYILGGTGANSYAGGIIAYNLASAGSVEYCYSIGKINSNAVNTGALIGYNSSISCTNNYWATDICNVSLSSGNSATADNSGVGISFANMQIQNNYTNWDNTILSTAWGVMQNYVFSNSQIYYNSVWEVYSLPRLWWEAQNGTATINFSANNGTGTSPSSVTYLIGQPIDLEDNLNLTKTDYAHTGWATTNNASIGEFHYESLSVSNGQSLTLYSTWGTIGTGTVSDPYLIYSFGNSSLIGSFEYYNNLATDTFASGKYYRLMHNINGAITSYSGTSTGTFSGNFDGNGKTITLNTQSYGLFYIVDNSNTNSVLCEISDLTIDIKHFDNMPRTSNTAYIVSGAVAMETIDNATLNNISVKGTFYGSIDQHNSYTTSSISRIFMGGFGAVGSDATLNNCSNYLDFFISESYSKTFSLSGIISNNVDNVTYNSCVNYGDFYNTRFARVGAVAGQTTNCYLINCLNYGKITIIENYTGLSVGAGICGIGTTNTKIINCVNYADIYLDIYNTADSEGVHREGYVAGIVGYSQETIDIIGCKNYGDIFGAYSGGICNLGYATDGSIATVRLCENYGKILGGYAAGGIGGYLHHSKYTINIYDCLNAGEIGSNDLNFKLRIGGLIGYIHYGNLTIYDCYNTGNVWLNTSLSYDLYVGGIIGSTTGAGVYMTRCYNTGTIDANNSTGSYAAGIANLRAVSGKTLDIEYCYNLGNVSGAQYNGAITGMYLFASGGSLANKANYYLSGTASYSNGATSSDITGKSSSDLQQKRTFMEWDFGYESGATSGYIWKNSSITVNGVNQTLSLPRLWWEGNGGVAIINYDLNGATGTNPSDDYYYINKPIKLSGGESIAKSGYGFFGWNSDLTATSGDIFYSVINDVEPSDTIIMNAIWAGSSSFGDGTKANPYLITTIGNASSTASIGSFNYYAYNNIFSDTSALHYFKQLFDLEIITDESLLNTNLNGYYLAENHTFNSTGQGSIFNDLVAGSINDLYVINNNLIEKNNAYSAVVHDNNGIIENVHFVGSINVTSVTSFIAGGIARVNGGTISNCSSEFDCVATGSVGENNIVIGGICAYINPDVVTTIENSFFDGTINISEMSGTGYCVIGGIVGSDLETLLSHKSSNVIACYNWGNIIAGTATNGVFVGGIFGRIKCAGLDIQNCYNTGLLTADSGTIGGIIGGLENSSSSIEYCYNIGTISGNSKGGIIGYISCLDCVLTNNIWQTGKGATASCGNGNPAGSRSGVPFVIFGVGEYANQFPINFSWGTVAQILDSNSDKTSGYYIDSSFDSKFLGIMKIDGVWQVATGYGEDDYGGSDYDYPTSEYYNFVYARLWWEYGTGKAIVSYDLNGGTGTAPSSHTIYNGRVNELASGEGFYKSGYAFMGWSTDPNATNASNVVSNLNYGIGENITLYAIYTQNVGSGTISDPYLIYNIGNNDSTAQIGSFNYYARNGYFTNSNEYYFKQMNNLNIISGQTVYDSAFYGKYEGNNKKIDITGENSLFTFIGSSSYVNCYVKNLDIYNYNFSYTYNNESGGILAQRVYAIEVNNVDCYGNIYINSVSGEYCSSIGGLFGLAYSGKVTIGNSNSYVNITDNAVSSIIYYVGGFIGRAESSSVNISFVNSNNYGNITSTTTASAKCAGFIGWAYGLTMGSCLNYGNIIGSTSGGFVANLEGGSSFANCSNFGAVEGADYAAGCVGNSISSDVSEFNNCSNNGSITADICGGIFSGDYMIFGAVNITNCKNTASVSGISCAGGLMAATSNTYSTTIIDSFNSGSVSSSDSMAGGLVGQVADGGNLNLDNCYNVGAITAGDSAGGIIGCNYGSVLIDHCYSIAQINGNGQEGGIVGYGSSSSITATNNIFANDSVASACPDYDMGSSAIGKTTAELINNSLYSSTNKTHSSYSNWQFGIFGETVEGYIWRAGTNGSYRPYLWWEDFPTATIVYDLNGGLGMAPATESYYIGTTINLASGEGISKEGYAWAGWSTKNYASSGIMTLQDNSVSNRQVITLYAVWTTTIGLGTKTNPYKIYKFGTATDLGSFNYYASASSSSSYAFSNTTNYSSKYYKIMFDLNLASGQTLVASSFYGNFDGNFKSITFNGAGSLFTNFSNATYAQSTINDLTLINNNITFTGTQFGLLAFSGCGNFSNIKVYGNYIKTNYSGTSALNIGGIIGNVISGGYTSSFYVCENHININLSFSAGYNYVVIAGGIIGNSENSAYIKLENCVNYGTINLASLPTYAFVGGIVGYSIYGQISQCENLGAISVTNTGTSTANQVGGIISYIGANFVVNDCYNQGAITINAGAGGAYVGGIVGVACGSLQYSYNSATINVTTTGYGYIGGIIGDIQGATIEYCYNIGNIISSGNNALVGGIAGKLTTGTLNYNYWVTGKGALKQYSNQTTATNGISFADMTDSTKYDADNKTHSSFSNWVFNDGNYIYVNDEIKIDDTANNEYLPRLTFENSDSLIVINYDANGATGTNPSNQVAYAGQDVKLSSGETLTKSGYTLTGWSLSSSATSGSFILNNFNAEAGSTVTFYAVWSNAFGSGTISDPYLIYQIGPNSSSASIGSFNYFARNNYFSNSQQYYFKQMADLTIESGQTLYDTNLYGFYNGDGYTFDITNENALFISVGSNSYTSAKLSNLNIINRNMSNNTTNSATQAYSCLILTLSGTLENVTSIAKTGSTAIVSTATDLYCSGLVGIVYTGGNAEIINCSSTVELNPNLSNLIGKTTNIYIGALFAYSSTNLTMENSTAKGSIAFDIVATSYVGGIGGSAIGQFSANNCVNYATITVNSTINTNSNILNIGGVIGNIVQQDATKGIVENIVNNGVITINASSYSNAIRLGGVVGSNTTANLTKTNANYSNWINNANINVNYTSLSMQTIIGGVVGYCEGRRLNLNTNNGDITINVSASSSNVICGGVVGDCLNSNIYLGKNLGSININNSNNLGAIQKVGGVVGYLANSSIVSACQNNGTITANTTGFANVGGIAGAINISSSSDITAINQSVNHGNIYATHNYNSSWAGDNYLLVAGVAGAIIGSATISYCYNTALISADISNAGSLAKANVSGIANLSDAQNSAYNVAISYCYNLGTLSGKANANAKVYGILSNGNSSGTSSNISYTNNYFASNKGAVVGGESVDTIVGLNVSTEFSEMTLNANYNSTTRTHSSYNGWTFELSSSGASGYLWSLDYIDIDGVEYFIYAPRLFFEEYSSASLLTFDLNGGQGTTISDKVYAIGSNLSLTTSGITKSGYTFAGWAISANAVIGKTNANALDIRSNTITTLYAVWTTQTLGGETNPYLISSISDFNYFAGNNDDSINYFANSSSYYFELTNDIAIASGESLIFTNLVNSSFNGNGYTLNISNCSALFNSINNSLIKNLNLVNDNVAYVTSGDSTIAAGYAISLNLSGTEQNTTGIKNSTFSGNVGESGNLPTYAVGFVYQITNASNYNYLDGIYNCINYASINSSSSASGFVAGVSSSNAYGNILNCINYGGISSLNAGGFVGNFVNTNSTINIINCVNFGSITSSLSSANVGGIVGSLANSTTIVIIYCYNAGRIDAKLNTSNIGGIAGYAPDNWGEDGIHIIESYNLGTIGTTGANKGAIIGYAGSSFGEVTDTYYLSTSCSSSTGNSVDAGSAISLENMQVQSNWSWEFGTYGTATDGWVFEKLDLKLDGSTLIGNNSLTLPRLWFENNPSIIVTYNINGGTGTTPTTTTYNLKTSTTLSDGSGLSFSNKKFMGWSLSSADTVGVFDLLDLSFNTINSSSITLYACWSGFGSGTSSDPYLIYDASSNIGGLNYYVGTTTGKFGASSGVYYKQMNDILASTLSLSNLTGIYDGNGYKLTITSNQSNEIFSIVSGTIKNLDIYITGVESGATISAILASQLNGTIINCNIRQIQDIEITQNVLPAIFVGSVIGGLISGCNNYVNVNAVASIGIFASTISVSARIENCGNYGNLANQYATSALVIASSNSTIINCSNYGNNYGAGIVFNLGSNSIVKNCANYGNNCINGITTYAGTNTTITNCLNNGNVTNSGIVGGNGINYVDIEYCYNTGSCAYGISSSASTSISNLTIKYCYNLGTATTNAISNYYNDSNIYLKNYFSSTSGTANNAVASSLTINQMQEKSNWQGFIFGDETALNGYRWVTSTIKVNGEYQLYSLPRLWWENYISVDTVNISYDSNSGTGSVENQTIKISNGDSLILNSGEGLSKSGYVFAGWSLNSNASIGFSRLDELGSITSSNIKVYAIWIATNSTLLGTGTINDPYKIFVMGENSASALPGSFNYYSRNIGNNGFAGTNQYYYKQMLDIDTNNTSVYLSNLYGYYDGNNKQIIDNGGIDIWDNIGSTTLDTSFVQNLSVYNNNIQASNQGVSSFARICYGIVKNCNVYGNANVAVNYDDYVVAGFALASFGGKFENVNNYISYNITTLESLISGETTSNGNLNDFIFGGIVGLNCYLSNKNAYIINSIYDGKLSANQIAGYLGGIIGYNYASGDINVKMLNLENCANKTNFIIDGTRANSSTLIIGGIIGMKNYGSGSTTSIQCVDITNNINYGNITIKNNISNLYLGGIGGKFEETPLGVFTNNINYGNLLIKVNMGLAYVGGLIGNFGSGYGSTPYMALSNSYNYGNVSVDSNNFEIWLGGCIGLVVAHRQITGLVNYGDIRVVNGDNQDYRCRIAGVVGFLQTASLTNSKNYGNIFYSSQVQEECDLIAGIVAYLAGSTVSQSANYGKIIAKSAKYVGGVVAASSSSASGTRSLVVTENVNYGEIQTNDCAYTGGVVGIAFNYHGNTGHSNIISYNYNCGKIIHNTSKDQCVGGILGWDYSNNNSTNTFSYNYNIGTINSNGDNVGGIVGKSSTGTSGTSSFSNNYWITGKNATAFAPTTISGETTGVSLYDIAESGSYFENWTYGVYKTATGGFVYQESEVIIDGEVKNYFLPRLWWESLDTCGENISHTYGNWIIETQPTCNTLGLKYKECSVDGHRYYLEIPKIDNHSFGDWVETTAPTSSSSGVETRTCSICGDTETIASYLVNFMIDGNVVSSQHIRLNGNAVEVTESQIEASLQANGYHLLGWYSNSGLTNAFNFSKAITNYTVVYGKVEAINITKTINFNDGTGDSYTIEGLYLNSYSLYNSSSFADRAYMNKYSLTGFTTISGSNTPTIGVSDLIKFTTDSTYYACYSQSKVKVTFVINANSVFLKNVEKYININSTYTFNYTDLELNNMAYTVNSLTFDGSTYGIGSSISIGTSDISVTVSSSSIGYAVTYKYGDSASGYVDNYSNLVISTNTNNNYNAEILLDNNSSNEVVTSGANYKYFTGWATTVSAVIPTIYPGQKYNISGNITLYAVYESPTDASNFTFVLSDTSYIISAVVNGLTRVIIPNSYNGEPVVGLEEGGTSSGLFTSNSATFVYVPSTISAISSNSFRSSTNVTTVILGSQVVSIFERAFINSSSLAYININNVTTIQSHAFYSATSLNNITLNSSITAINDYTFYNCQSLSTLNTDNIILIYNAAFYRCYNLANIDLSSVTKFYGQRHFEDCTSLTSVDLSSLTGFFNETVGTADYRGYTFIRCSNLKTVVLNSALTYLYNYTFYNCTSLETINTNNIKTLYTYCFAFCTSLNNINVEKVTAIGQAAFRGCSSITNLKFSALGASALNSSGKTTVFANCSSLVNLELPLITIITNESIFDGCTSLKTIKLNALTSITTTFFNFGSACLENIYINSVSTINDNQFQNYSKLKYVYLGTNLTSIGARAFSGCGKLISCDILSNSSNNIYSIGTYAFNECYNLTGNLDFNNLSTLGTYAFFKCYELTSCDLTGSTLTSITTACFSYCSKITTITIPSSVKTLSGYSMKYCTSLTTINLQNVTTIGQFALQRCTSLQTIDISSVNNLNFSYAFDGCTSLVTLTNGFKSSLTIITDYVFRDCSSLVLNTNDLQYVTTIGQYAFYNCNALTTINLTNVTSLGASAFSSASNLTSVTLGSGLTTLQEATFKWCSSLATINFEYIITFSKDSVYGCEALITINASNAVTIGEAAFFGCFGLTSIDLSSATSIGYCTFQFCYNLTTVTLGTDASMNITLDRYTFNSCLSLSNINLSRVTSIGNYCFQMVKSAVESLSGQNLSTYTNGSLTSIDLSALTSISVSAFRTIDTLTSVTLNSTSSVVIGENAFRGSIALQSIDLSSVTSIGKRAFDGCTNLEQIILGENLTSIYLESDSRDEDEASILISSFAHCGNLHYVLCANSTIATLAENSFANTYIYTLKDSSFIFSDTGINTAISSLTYSNISTSSLSILGYVGQNHTAIKIGTSYYYYK